MSRATLYIQDSLRCSRRRPSSRGEIGSTSCTYILGRPSTFSRGFVALSTPVSIPSCIGWEAALCGPYLMNFCNPPVLLHFRFAPALGSGRLSNFDVVSLHILRRCLCHVRFRSFRLSSEPRNIVVGLHLRCCLLEVCSRSPRLTQGQVV